MGTAITDTRPSGTPLHQGYAHVKLADILTFSLLCHDWAIAVVVLMHGLNQIDF